jgi:hypothetical protein
VNRFVILYADNSVKDAHERTVSNMLDMEDTGAMEGVVGIYAADERSKLAQIAVAEQRNYNGFDAEASVYYASARLTAGKRLVGYAHYTHH